MPILINKIFALTKLKSLAKDKVIPILLVVPIMMSAPFNFLKLLLIKNPNIKTNCGKLNISLDNKLKNFLK